MSLAADKDRFRGLARKAGRLHFEKKLTREEWVVLTRDALEISHRHGGRVPELDMGTFMVLVDDKPEWLAEFGW